MVSSFLASPSSRWRARRTPVQPRWRSVLVGMASVPAWRSGLTRTVQPNDTDIHASLREKYLQGMGSRVFKTSGTTHGTFLKTAIESHETFMRRGGGVQIDEEPHVARKKRKRHKTKQYWHCDWCNVRMGGGTKRQCSTPACKRLCCTTCLAIDPGAPEKLRRICPHCVAVGNCLGFPFI